MQRHPAAGDGAKVPARSTGNKLDGKEQFKLDRLALLMTETPPLIPPPLCNYQDTSKIIGYPPDTHPMNYHQIHFRSYGQHNRHPQQDKIYPFAIPHFIRPYY